MVLKCCICKIQSDDPNGSSVSYHKLPAREDLREEWMKVLRKHCPSLTQKYLYVCSHHFERHCFQYSGMCQRRMLKSGSKPTIFTYFEVNECQEQGSNKSLEPATQHQSTNVESSQVENEFQSSGRNIETNSTGQTQQDISNKVASDEIALKNKLKQTIRQRDAKIQKLQRQNKNLIIRLGRCRKKFYRYKYLFEALIVRQTKYISDSENTNLQVSMG